MHQIQPSELVKGRSFADHPLPVFLPNRNITVSAHEFMLQAGKPIALPLLLERRAVKASFNINQSRFNAVNQGGDNG